MVILGQGVFWGFKASNFALRLLTGVERPELILLLRPMQQIAGAIANLVNLMETGVCFLDIVLQQFAVALR